MKTMTTTLLLAVIAGALAGAGSTYVLTKVIKPSQDQLISAFYETETATLVSPHHLRKEYSKSTRDFVLVDVRSEEEYIREHVIEAVNIPAYKDPNTSAYGDVERIVSSFQKLTLENPDKDIIVYCYSIPCMTGSKIGRMLAQHDVFVKGLGVGWNEWRYDWNAWNHEHEWDVTDVKDYISSGKEPGVYAGKSTSTACPIEGELGC
jgi:rhodanese-related sulfurtransferase